ncbi:hypothetical protein PMAN_a2580 [Pseudoalteromonas marina]|nr:hypothetical protein PMAN_a2580 [Pseudoalteromonas marina]
MCVCRPLFIIITAPKDIVFDPLFHVFSALEPQLTALK